ncbi:MAG: hypothetical protein U0836_19455 [Pirellulales bacterium]
MTLTEFFDVLPLFSLFAHVHLLPAVVPAGYWLLRWKTVRQTNRGPGGFDAPLCKLGSGTR